DQIGGPQSSRPDMESVNVTTLTEADLHEISQTRRRWSGESADADPVALERRLRWLILDNPAMMDDVPAGWVVRTSNGQLAGKMFCVPQRFASDRGTQTCLL